MNRRRRPLLGSERGSELIELAIVLPILLLVFAAIVDFGLLFQRYEVVTNAVREGARVGVLPGYTTNDVRNRVNDYLNSGGLNAGLATVTVAYGAQAIGGGGPVINVVNVQVSYPHPWLAIGPMAAMVGGAGWSSINLRARSIMRTEIAAGGS